MCDVIFQNCTWRDCVKIALGILQQILDQKEPPPEIDYVDYDLEGAQYMIDRARSKNAKRWTP
jgi:hypothetical protein